MRLALGSYPDVRLADARAKQAEAKALKRKGVDPIHAKQVAKLQSTAQADDNFEAVARDWHSKQISNWSEGHAKTVIRRLERDLFPWIGKRPMVQLHAMELLAALQKIEDRQAIETAHRVLDIARQVWDYWLPSADNVARLAGLFEKFNPNGGTSISQDSLQRAAQICAWHLEEARRFLGELVLPQDLSDAFRLEKWLVLYSKDKETVSQRDAQNAGPVRDKKRLDVALAELESLNRIRTVQEGKRKLIKVNPMVMQ